MGQSGMISRILLLVFGNFFREQMDDDFIFVFTAPLPSPPLYTKHRNVCFDGCFLVLTVHLLSMLFAAQGSRGGGISKQIGRQVEGFPLVGCA